MDAPCASCASAHPPQPFPSLQPVPCPPIAKAGWQAVSQPRILTIYSHEQGTGLPSRERAWRGGHTYTSAVLTHYTRNETAAETSHRRGWLHGNPSARRSRQRVKDGRGGPGLGRLAGQPYRHRWMECSKQQYGTKKVTPWTAYVRAFFGLPSPGEAWEESSYPRSDSAGQSATTPTSVVRLSTPVLSANCEISNKATLLGALPRRALSRQRRGRTTLRLFGPTS